MNDMFKEYMMNHASYKLTDDINKELLKKTYDMKDDDFLVKEVSTLLKKKVYALSSSTLYISPSLSVDIKGLKCIEEKELKTYVLHYINKVMSLFI